jgi:hypothetical protein
MPANRKPKLPSTNLLQKCTKNARSRGGKIGIQLENSFSSNFIFCSFMKMCTEILKEVSTNCNHHFTWRRPRVESNTRWMFIGAKNQTAAAERNKPHSFYLTHIFHNSPISRDKKKWYIINWCVHFQARAIWSFHSSEWRLVSCVMFRRAVW